MLARATIMLIKSAISNTLFKYHYVLHLKIPLGKSTVNLYMKVNHVLYCMQISDSDAKDCLSLMQLSVITLFSPPLDTLVLLIIEISLMIR